MPAGTDPPSGEGDREPHADAEGLRSSVGVAVPSVLSEGRGGAMVVCACVITI